MRKAFFILIVLLGIQLSAYAQIQKIEISIAGLTCSQCSKSVEMQLKKIKELSTIEMDLKNTIAYITPKKNAVIDFYRIAKAVDDAGFSVSALHAYIDLNFFKKEGKDCYSLRGEYFQFTKSPHKNVLKVQFLGKKFGPKTFTPIHSSCSVKSFYIVQPS